ncbi:MAG: cupin-like domain-containing protein [Pseudomonadota bacterium]
MSEGLSPIREWSDVDQTCFEQEILPLNQPAVMRGLANHWPIVQKMQESAHAAGEYLKSFDKGNPLYTILGSPEIEGRFFYSDDLTGVNFQRTRGSLSVIVDQLQTLGEHAPAIAIQAAEVEEALPGFTGENAMPLLAPEIRPTLWMGNQALVAPHYDVHDNIACVVMGERTFTLFPPEQISNLYIGPTLNAPGGVPISMVDLNNPDLETYPRFADALAAAQQATLQPGDAIFIPTPWWHAVQSLADINVLINYWWGGVPVPAANTRPLSPNHSLIHSMMTIAKMSPDQRESWRQFFNYLVFQTGEDPTAHLPDGLNDLVTNLSPEQRQAVYQLLKDQLN